MSKFSVDLKETLEKTNEKSKKEQDALLALSGLGEIKGLLAYDSQRDAEIISSLGINSVNATLNEVKAKSIELEKAEKFYEQTVFEEEQIKTLCLDYNLKFLPTSLFIGAFSVEVAAKIKNLEKTITKSRIPEMAAKRNLTIEEYLETDDSKREFNFDTHQLKTKFFIMAPGKMFNLEKRPKPAKIVDYDPILFYKTEENKYVMVHKWGQDFTIFRAIKGFIFRNELTMLLTVALTIMAVAALSFSLFTNVFVNGNYFFNWLVPTLIVLISPMLAIMLIPKTGSDVYSANGWNTQFKS